MATETKRLTELTGEALSQLLGLIGSSDSVELKLTLPADAQRPTIKTLGLDPLEAQIRQVFFLDTPDLALNQSGWSFAPAESRAEAATRWSSCAQWFPTTCPTTSATRRTSTSRSTRCRAATSARRR